MIVATWRGGSVVLEGELRAGSSAYVDADWIPKEDGRDVQALVAADGILQLATGSEVAGLDDLDVDLAAALALWQVAEEAASLVKEVDAGAVEVIGRGLVAEFVRELVGEKRPEFKSQAIVDTTGDPAAITTGLPRLANMGIFVLAGDPLGRECDLDLYPDVHARGLKLLGVGMPLSRGALAADPGVLDRLGCWPPVKTSLCQPLPPGAAWFRVAA